ncbi:hypothetical protein NMY22_g4444 [Coprinellus aureogranulatus]|nr:hypothetical protein NMY22_g4444 [Coprinellus aureogranulatus]
MKRPVKDAVIRNLVEFGSVMCRWVHFCLRSGHPCLPAEELGDKSLKTEQDRYPAQARLLLHLLDLDDSSYEALLSSDAFIQLFLELWSGEYARDGNRIIRAMDVSTNHVACPIITLLTRDKFSQALVDRVASGVDSPNCKVAGFARCLLLLFKIARILWDSDMYYRDRLRRLGFLTYMCEAWNLLSPHFADKNDVNLGVRCKISIPALVDLLALALDESDRRIKHKNQRDLIAGGFLDVLFRSLVIIDNDIWDAISLSLIPALGRLLVYPSLIPPTLFGDSSAIEIIVDNPSIALSWNAILRALEWTKATSETLSKRTTVLLCDNETCDGIVTGEGVAFKQCGGCSSTVYCSAVCQAIDWRSAHQRECADARKMHTAREFANESYERRLRASQAALVETIYAEKFSPEYENRDVMPVFDFTDLHNNSVETSSYTQHLVGLDTFWQRKMTTPASFPQTYLQSRLQSLADRYTAGTYPLGWRLAEGIFPGYGDEQAIYLTVLLKPEENRYRGVYAVARFM